MPRIGKYEIDEEIGRGGFGIVYRGHDRTLTDEEVNSVHARLTEALTNSLGVSLRV